MRGQRPTGRFSVMCVTVVPDRGHPVHDRLTPGGQDHTGLHLRVGRQSAADALPLTDAVVNPFGGLLGPRRPWGPWLAQTSWHRPCSGSGCSPTTRAIRPAALRPADSRSETAGLSSRRRCSNLGRSLSTEQRRRARSQISSWLWYLGRPGRLFGGAPVHWPAAIALSYQPWSAPLAAAYRRAGECGRPSARRPAGTAPGRRVMGSLRSIHERRESSVCATARSLRQARVDNVLDQRAVGSVTDAPSRPLEAPLRSQVPHLHPGGVQSRRRSAR
jgi:hypothetical protein